MPYLTPSEIPEENTCRVLLIPDSYEWDAIIYGALSELAKAYNWEAYGAVSVDEAISEAQVLLDEYAASSCSELGGGCELLDGSLTLRLGIGGAVEQWDGEEWVEPTGDYEQPPIPPRTETTDDEKRCLAAANAVAVYAELYEVVTDAATDFEFLDEFLDAVFAGLDTWLGLWVGETAKSFAQLSAWAVNKFFFIWEEITEDYWDEDFEVQFACILYNNSIVNGDGSVSFDYDSVMSELQLFALTSLDISYIFLWAQLEYLFYFAAGGDGLNAAGGTTAVEEYDCDDCEDNTWCYYFDFEETDGGFSRVVETGFQNTGTYSAGVGWVVSDYLATGFSPDQANRSLRIDRTFTAPTTITECQIFFDWTGGTYDNTSITACEIYCGSLSATFSRSSLGSSGSLDRSVTGTASLPTAIQLAIRTSRDTSSPYSYSGDAILKACLIRGTGENPFGDDNCPED